LLKCEVRRYPVTGSVTEPLQDLIYDHFRLVAENRRFIAFPLRTSTHHLEPRNAFSANISQLSSRPERPREACCIYHDGKLAVFDTRETQIVVAIDVSGAPGARLLHDCRMRKRDIPLPIIIDYRNTFRPPVLRSVGLLTSMAHYWESEQSEFDFKCRCYQDQMKDISTTLQVPRTSDRAATFYLLYLLVEQLAAFLIRLLYISLRPTR